MVAATTLVVAAPAGAAAPVVTQMVVFEDGSAKFGKVRASATRVKVGRKRCAVAAGTPLAALVRGRVGTLRVADFGDCGRSSRDSGGLYVRGIRGDVITGPEDPEGWVYKVGNKAAPAGAADPSGPFGRGKLRSRQRVTWFWCKGEPGVEGCQRTLDLKANAGDGGNVTLSVRGYDNSGRGIAIANASITSGGTVVATTDASGTATATLPAGEHTLVAGADGLVRSHPVEVTVR